MDRNIALAKMINLRELESTIRNHDQILDLADKEMADKDSPFFGLPKGALIDKTVRDGRIRTSINNELLLKLVTDGKLVLRAPDVNLQDRAASGNFVTMLEKVGLASSVKGRTS